MTGGSDLTLTDIYSSLSLIWRYSYCLVFEGATSIRKLGVGVSIDDFGTGFSSLSRQAYLPVTEVKIDKSFIDQFTHDRRVNALVEAVVHIGHNLDMVVVAEGVESISQWNCLKHMGCPVIQGYLFSGALPAGTVPDWIRSFRKKVEQQGLHN
ncbi:TPA: EAL domain-containing protein [Klebsiella pneumoniae]|nr:EAL domain-containing protein [Klebsiella pneumoniae]